MPESQSEALRWFIRAARQGDKTAQHNLGVHYATHELAQSTLAAAEEAEREAHDDDHFLRR